MVMLLHDLFLHKATSREVIISLFASMLNTIAHGTYLEIKMTRPCFCWSWEALRERKLPIHMANSHAMIIFKSIRGCNVQQHLD